MIAQLEQDPIGTIAKLRADLKDAQANRKQAEDAASEARRLEDASGDALARALCPFNVGDVVPCCGHSHKGKAGTVIEVRRPIYAWRDVHWCVRLHLLKRDGTIGLVVADFDESDWRKAREPKAITKAEALQQ